MVSDTLLLLIIGGLLFVAGVAVSGGNRRPEAQTTVIGISLFGAVRQTLFNVGNGVRGARERTPRDWIGWGLSAAGLVVGIVGLLDPAMG